MDARFKFPFAPFDQLVFDTSRDFEQQIALDRPLGSEGGFRDFAGLLAGARRLTADVAWISVLQYFGSHERGEHSVEDKQTESEHEGGYPALKKMVLRVTRLDPTFHYAYLYGSSALGWGLNRPDEAIEILVEGIHYNPTYWRLRLYVGALIFKQKGQMGEMLGLLEDAIRFPDCPTMLKSILANIYKQRQDYRRALAIWADVHDNVDVNDWYYEQSEKQIAELTRLIKILIIVRT